MIKFQSAVMSQTTQCRLCLNNCTAERKDLYERNGCRNLDIYNLVSRFIQPKFLNKLTAICLPCWQRISDFHGFQNNLILHQRIQTQDSNGHSDAELSLKNEFLSDNEFVTNTKHKIKEEISIEETVVNLCEQITKRKRQKFLPKTSPSKGAKKQVRTAKDLDNIISKSYTSLECGICKESQANFSILQKHFREKHIDDRYPYIICCKYKLQNRAHVADHARYHVDPNVFKCKICDICYATKSHLGHHVRSQHAAGKETSDKSKKPNFGPNEIQQKRFDDIISQWISCLECGVCKEPHANYDALRQHFFLKHPKERQPYIKCCNQKLERRLRMAEHARFHMDPSTFKCQKCGKCYATKISLDRHRVSKHAGKYKCSYCDKVFRTLTKIQEHTASHTGSYLYKCRSCSVTFAYQSNLCHHLRLKHPELWSQRESIPNFFDSMQASNDQNDDNSKKPTVELDHVISKWKTQLECGVCQELHANVTLLNTHFSHEHPEQSSFILCCDIKLHTRSEIANHAKVHLRLSALKCHVCDKTFTSKTQVNQHKKEFHSANLEMEKQSRQATCSVCDKSFASERYLKLHMPIHSKVDNETSEAASRQTKCGVCDRVFTSWLHLRQHTLSVHTMKHSYKCLACPQTFRSFNLLFGHIRREHPEKWAERKKIPHFLASMRILDDTENEQEHATATMAETEEDEYISKWLPGLNCGICKEACRNFIQLAQHFFHQHPNEKAHIFCCERKISVRFQLLQHAKYHENPDIFKCNLCEKSYKGPIALALHLKKVHGVAPPKLRTSKVHQCTKCERVFKNPIRLREHMTIHTRKALYKCMFCPKTSRYMNTMYRHWKSVHPEEYDAQQENPAMKLYQSLEENALE